MYAAAYQNTYVLNSLSDNNNNNNHTSSISAIRLHKKKILTTNIMAIAIFLLKSDLVIYE